MPRGQKSKARAREKRRDLKKAQAKAAEKGESSACSDQASGDAKPSTSTAGFPKQSQSSAPSTTVSKGMAQRRSDKGDQGEGDGKESSGALLSSGNIQMDLLTRKTGMLMEYMLCKYRVQQTMKRGEMIKVINRRFKEHFPDILKKASYRLDVVFGLELKEVQPNGQSFVLVSNLDFEDGSRRNELSVPTRGILIPLLSVLFLNNYCAPEEEVWHFLNVLGVYDGIVHTIFGDIRKVITEELVQEKYVEHRQVPNSDPPSYEFLWGLRAYAETSQVKVMEFLAKVSENMPGVYLSRYEQAMIEEQEKAQAEAEAAAAATAKLCTKAKAKAKAKAKGYSKTKLSHPTHK